MFIAPTLRSFADVIGDYQVLCLPTSTMGREMSAFAEENQEYRTRHSVESELEKLVEGNALISGDGQASITLIRIAWPPNKLSPNQFRASLADAISSNSYGLELRIHRSSTMRRPAAPEQEYACAIADSIERAKADSIPIRLKVADRDLRRHLVELIADAKVIIGENQDEECEPMAFHAALKSQAEGEAKRALKKHLDRDRSDITEIERLKESLNEQLNDSTKNQTRKSSLKRWAKLVAASFLLGGLVVTAEYVLLREPSSVEVARASPVKSFETDQETSDQKSPESMAKEIRQLRAERNLWKSRFEALQKDHTELRGRLQSIFD
ncbi:MAG: hypothetical protein AAF664_04725 [Planctomycetota bacterium]